MPRRVGVGDVDEPVEVRDPRRGAGVDDLVAGDRLALPVTGGEVDVQVRDGCCRDHATFGWYFGVSGTSGDAAAPIVATAWAMAAS